MNQQEILEYKKNCAELLGLTIITDGISWFDTDYKALKSYDSDWNCIMEVVEKILNICLALDSMEMYCNIADAIPDKEAVVEAINQFLIYHNENKS